MRRTRSIALIVLLFFSGSLVAQTKQVRAGNKLYHEKKYKEAASAYQQALAKNPSYVPGMFNLGNALFQQKNLEAARQVMGAAAKQAKDKGLKASANYNIGNTYMQEQKWQEAIDAYKQALKSNPQDEAAKYNLSYALAMMKKQQEGDGKNNDKNNKDQKQDEQSKDQQDSKEKDKDQQDRDQDKQQPQDDKQEKERPQPQESKLSEKQAEQLLNALAQEEKKLHDKKEKGKAVKIKVEKDW